MLGWIVDSINMTISLSPHHVTQLKEIVHAYPLLGAGHGVDNLL